MKKVLLSVICLFFFNQMLTAQIGGAMKLEPVKLSYNYKLVETGEYEITVTLDLEGKWCAYSMDLPKDGPVPTSLELDNITNLEIIGKPAEKAGKKGKEVTAYDNMFEMELKKFYKQAIFSIRCKVIDATQPVSFDLNFEYMTCDGERCLAPQFITKTKELNEHLKK